MDAPASSPESPLPGRREHFVHTYQDLESLAEQVSGYLAAGLDRGEALIVIARPAHRARFLERIGPFERDQVLFLDADETLGRFMAQGMPQWEPFRNLAGGAIADLRLRYPGVCAYGEMVDVLWQRGEREAAIRLEEYW